MTSTELSSVIEVKDLTVRFRARDQKLASLFSTGGSQKWLNAVDGVSFSIQSGDTFGLVGETGSGKSTIAKVLVGLYRPTSGTVKLLGKEINFKDRNAISYLRKNVGIVFQDPVGSLNSRLTVREIISEALIASKSVPEEEFDSRIQKIIEHVGKSALPMHPREISGGEKQRVSLARALVVPKKLLILDEPTSSLDMTIQAQVLNTLKSLKSELQLSFLFITHDINVIRYMSTRLAVLFYGRMMEVGNTFDVLSAPKHPYSIELLSNIPQITRNQPSTTDPGEVLVEHHPAPSGCNYRDVCPKAFSKCVNEPALKEIVPQHSVACFLYHDVEKMTVTPRVS
jgi:oligopeptide/dipeptide ABC transporter ATP-binding protein